MSSENDDLGRDRLIEKLVDRHAALLAGQIGFASSDLSSRSSPVGRATACLRALEAFRRARWRAACSRSPESPDSTVADLPTGADDLEASSGVETELPMAWLIDAEGRNGDVVSLGRFQIFEEIGGGAHGIVYRAFDPVLCRDVALKIPRLETLASETRRRRFLQESRAVAALVHPNIVPVYECGEVGPACYIASYYCVGPTLATWQKRQPLPIDQRMSAAIVSQLADAVAHVHSRGILHRDIKPANVLLEIGERGLVPRLTDFGLARLLDEAGAGTSTGAILGTLQYMAPEQAQGQSHEVTTAGDIFSLGAILYELLTGRPPFQGTTALEILRQFAAGTAIPPRKHRLDVDRDLQSICLKCLELAPTARYATADALADDLRSFLNGRPVAARDPGTMGRLRKWARRSPVVAALSAAVAVLVVSGIAGVLWQWQRAESFRKIATEHLDQAHQSVKELHSLLYDGDRFNKSEFDPLRRELMRANVNHYEAFLLRKGHDPDLRNDLADACYQLAIHAGHRRELPEAVTWHEKSASLRRDLVAEFPQHREYRRLLAQTLHHLGQAYHRQGRTAEAVSLFEESISIYEAIFTTENFSDALAVGTCGKVCYNLAQLYTRTGKIDHALALFEKSRHLFERAVVTDPQLEQFRVALARGLCQTAATLEALKRPAEALVYCDQALTTLAAIQSESGHASGVPAAMLQTLFCAFSSCDALQEHEKAIQYEDRCEQFCDQLASQLRDAKVAEAVAINRRKFARVYAARREISLAVPLYREACRIYEMAHDKEPASETVALELAKTYDEFAAALRKFGEPAEALLNLERSRALLQRIRTSDPKSQLARLQLVSNGLALGDLRLCVDERAAAVASFEEALGACRSLCEAVPDDVRAARLLQDCQKRLRRTGALAAAHVE